ncbi:hypothetical protein N8I84_02305 [Streptomyces cynarae]|uniref:Uncharacterized protein n=1 Tax=Streptomyces cynarae TaxID=2981134 RepID=A0ABY6EJA8_9ACTN|nr:hypothetical protein [Streptomyces cynarae]UXY24373.1 hypothetical protein N8I84_02305 [Streptomyces cynarae]
MFVEAATGFPVLLFTAALVVVVCFWLLVALGVTALDSFDADVELDGWGMGGVPVAVALSLLTVLAWFLGVGGRVLPFALAPSGAMSWVLRPLVSAAALLAAWRLTCLFVRPLHKVCPDEPGPVHATADDRTA